MNNSTTKNEIKQLSESVTEVLEVPYEVITKILAIDLNKSLFAIENSLQSYDFNNVCIKLY